MPVCPACGFPGTLYKCDVCGDVRCNGHTVSAGGQRGACGTTKSPFGTAKPAVPNGRCHVCRKGKYRRI